MEISEFLTKFKANLSSPESYLNPSPELRGKCLTGVKKVFDFYKKSCKNGCVKIPNGPLPELYTDGFDNEQIWEEIQLMNEPVLEYMGKLLKEMESWDYTKLFSDNKLGEQSQSHSSGSGHGKEDDIEDDIIDDADNEEHCVDEDYSDGDEGIRGRGSSNRHTGRKTVVDDQFFKLSEMEQFLEKMEREEEQDSEMEDSDGIDYFLEQPQVNSSQASYADFFDPPEQEESEGTSDQEVQTGAGDSDQDVGTGFGTSAETSEDISGYIVPGESDEEEELSSSESRDGDGGSEDEDVTEGDESEPVKEEDEQQVLSTREKKHLKLKKQVERLEAANVAEKPWQMSGETSAKTRPLNSLLEEDLSFDHMSRPPPVITEETTKTLEDIIKQRIIDEAWDDVERRVKPVEKPYDYSKSRPLEQEKSKLSLAEVYEQEYIKQTRGAEEVKEDKRHIQIRELMKNLFVKLDALSNFHFTPKPPKPEVKIVPSVPAIQMEEVAPLATSDAMLAAPEEVQAKSRKPEVGTTEKTVTDRKRERRLKKKQKRLRLAEKRHREKIISKIHPGLGNKYSRKELSKKLKQREQDEAVDKSLRSSSKFFAELQDKVLDEVKAEKRDRNTQSRDRTSSGKHFKL